MPCIGALRTSPRLRAGAFLRAGALLAEVFLRAVVVLLMAGFLATFFWLDFFATFFSSANTLMPIVARDILHVGAVEYGQSVG